MGVESKARKSVPSGLAFTAHCVEGTADRIYSSTGQKDTFYVQDSSCYSARELLHCTWWFLLADIKMDLNGTSSKLGELLKNLCMWAHWFSLLALKSARFLMCLIYRFCASRALLSKLHQTHVCFWCLNESWVCFLFLSSINNNVSCLMSKIETKITNINQQELLILIHIYHKIKKGASASKQKNIVVSWLEKCFTISHVPWLLSVGFLSTHICHPKQWGGLLVLASWHVSVTTTMTRFIELNE